MPRNSLDAKSLSCRVPIEGQWRRDSLAVALKQGPETEKPVLKEQAIVTKIFLGVCQGCSI